MENSNEQNRLNRRRFAVSAAAGASALLTACRLPRSQPAAKPSRKLKLLSYNVWYGFTKKPERKANYLKFMQAQAPDVVSLQELNHYTSEKLADDAKAWVTLGDGHATLGRWAESAAAYREAVSLRPMHADSWASLGNAQEEIYEPEEAEASWRRAVALQPDRSVA